MISCEEMPASAAAVDEAPLVEWAVSIAVSTPLSFKTCFNHPAIVEENTGLCGETVAKKSWSLPWSLKPSVAFSYAFKQATGHRIRSSDKSGIHIGCRGSSRPGADCFATPFGRDTVRCVPPSVERKSHKV